MTTWYVWCEIHQDSDQRSGWWRVEANTPQEALYKANSFYEPAFFDTPHPLFAIPSAVMENDGLFAGVTITDCEVKD